MSAQSILANARSNDEVPLPPYPPTRRAWLEMCQRIRYLWMIADGTLNEPPTPKPMTAEELLRLIGSLLNDTHKQILRELLIELLRDDVIEIVQWYGEANP